ncbi:MAG: PRC-barrel domain containing protein [Proteobacteria bacterium]|nr:PRC-barrel domain containing protein [Pseudomonadota bacterium]
MIDIPLYAKVLCTDGECGKSTYVVINPATETLTHFVVEDKHAKPLPVERLVPIELVIETDAHTIHLDCNMQAFAELGPFTKTEYIENAPVDYSGPDAPVAYAQPYALPLEAYYTQVEIEQIPAGELAVRRHAQVEAQDGIVGEVGEFLVNPENGHISHLILKRGHLWRKKEVMVPIANIERAEEFTVYLNITKEDVSALPEIPLKRNYQSD